MKRSIFRKVISILITVSLLISTASLAAIELAALEPGDHTVPASNVTNIQNDYLKFYTESGGNRFGLYTTGGNPESNTDNNARLLYATSSHTVIRINSSDYVFSPVSTYLNADGTSLYATNTYNGVQVDMIATLAYNTYTGRNDVAEIRYVMTNVSGEDKAAGARIFFDTMLGSNDSAPFRVNGNRITYETRYTGDAIPQVWQVFDNINNPSVVASGTFYSNPAERPDKVEFMNYGTGSSDSYSCSINTGSSIGDSAVSIYFDPDTLAPGQSRTAKTVYGLSSFDPAPPPAMSGLSVRTMAPVELLANGACDAYEGNPFTFNAWLTNTGNTTLTGVVATLRLGAGLSTEQALTLNVGNISVGGEAPLAWQIEADLYDMAQLLTYELEYSADGVEAQTVTKTIALPALDLVCEHDYANAQIVTPATCEEAGVTLLTCTHCGDTVYGYIPATGHRYDTVVTREATCTEPGLLTHTCRFCGDSYGTYVYAEHTFSLAEHVDASCTVDGYDRYACSCGESYTETIPGGHNYVGTITRVVSAEQDGEVTYTCSICGDFYVEIIPARPQANILLVQDRLPWSENNNVALLNQMQNDGYIDGWDLTTTAAFESINLAGYNVILIANDQSTATYNQLGRLSERLSEFATAGGVVIYGACDHGWAGGNISYSLPENVTKSNYYSHYNYIVDSDHPIVLGNLTDGRALTDSLLYGNYCSHTSFGAASLPADANVILRDARGNATLVEYAMGNGRIILSGLTWEFYYTRNAYDGRSNTTYTKNVYDDLIMYAVYQANACDHSYDAGTVVLPTCEERGYTEHTCYLCGGTMRDQFTDALGHLEGAWTVVLEPTYMSPGREALCCERNGCGEELASREIAPFGSGYAYVSSDLEDVILGEEITLRLVIANCDTMTALALVPHFDANVFDLVSMSWAREALIQDIESGTYRAVSAFAEPTDVNGTVFEVVLRAKTLTAYTTVDFTLLAEFGQSIEEITVTAKTVAVTECAHSHMIYAEMNEQFHSATCVRCGLTVALAHTYDNHCDAVCNDCGHTRVPPHLLEDEYGYDAYDHWLVCEECGYVDVATPHEYDNGCDATCNACAYIRIAGHRFSATWCLDEANHWRECLDCGEVEELLSHTYDSCCDAVCNDCGYIREAPHRFSETYRYDDTNHWYECEDCGMHTVEWAHVYDSGSDPDCNHCDYVRFVRGDVDNDGDVDSDDSEYLVYHLFFEDEYPVTQPLDFNGDGVENSRDSIYLLYFVFFGEGQYPLN